MSKFDAEYYEFVEANLSSVIREMSAQPEAADPKDPASFEELMSDVRKWIEDHGEYGVAYEAMVAELERGEFRLSGRAAVKLLEVGLLFGFKTERPQDKRFNLKTPKP
jgi:hypothetical protein